MVSDGIIVVRVSRYSIYVVVYYIVANTKIIIFRRRSSRTSRSRDITYYRQM